MTKRLTPEGTNALREGAALLKAVADNTSVGLVIVDRDHRYKFANDVYMKILGRTESIIGKTPAEVLPPTYNNQTGARLERAFAGERVAFEASLPDFASPTGKVKHYSAVYEPEFDEDENIIGAVVVVIDITEQKAVEEHIRFLLDEVNHRAKNLLAVVTAIARNTAKSSPLDFFDQFEARLQALAVNQDLLVQGGWKSIDLQELARKQLAHLGDLIGRRIFLDGPSLRLSAEAAQAIGMATHELTTNAVKHGALSSQSGSVHVAWGLGDGPDGQELTINWVEKNGPPVNPPSRLGFGSTVVTKLVEGKLGGKSTLDYARSGLRWSFRCAAAVATTEP